MNERTEKILIPVIAILMGILLGVLILVVTGRSVGSLFTCLFQSITGIDLTTPGAAMNPRYPGELMVYTMPLILTGLCVGFAYRCGMFNIGAEGQVIVGSCVSCCLAILCPMPNFVGPIVCLLAGGLAGALWAFIPGILKSKFNISEVVTGIMLNYTALYGCNYFLRALPESSPQRTVDIPQNIQLGDAFLKTLTNNSRFHWGFIVCIIAIIAYWFIIERTSFGYSLRATGFNKEGARYAGIKVNKSIILSIMISGFLAGLAGAIIVQGTFGYGRVMTAADNYGFDGIAVALVGGCNAIGTLFAAFLFGLLKVAQPLLQTSGVPREIGQIISSSIVFFVAIQWVIKQLLDKFRKKKEAKPTGPALVKEGGASK